MLNVALFGSSPYIKPLLETLVKSTKLRFTLFVTKPDLTHFDLFLKDTNVEIAKLPTLKSPDKETLLGLLEKHRIDIGIVADYGLIIPLSIIQKPPYGLINIHFSPLPKYRGASPVQYTILNGETQTAYTFIAMLPEDTPQVDSGKIIHQVFVPLTSTETTETLYTSLFQKAATDLEEIILAYTHSPLSPIPPISPISQDHSQATYTTPSGSFDRTTLLTKDDGYVSADMSDEYIERATRAFTPWPRAWTTLGELLKIAQRFDPSVTKLQDMKSPDIRVQLLEGHLENGTLVIDRVQADGKKPAPWKEFKNGYFQ